MMHDDSRPRVLGAVVDAETRCIHYRSPLDVIAIAFACCGEFYPCHLCHAEAADHEAELWPTATRDARAVLCGVCGHVLTIDEYAGTDVCPACRAAFNPGCKLHWRLYFEGIADEARTLRAGMSFSDVVPHLAETRVVAIITRRADGARAATPIWAVVVDGVPYIRSAYGETAWWYRHVLAGRDVEFVLADGAIAETDKAAALALPATSVALEAVPVDDAVQPAIDAALWAKYGDDPTNAAATMTPQAVGCTLRVVAPVAAG